MKIGPYEILGEIGRGGMGTVYKALDPQTSDRVAINMLNGAGALDPRGRMGLVREASTSARLRHPNIIRVRDIGQHKGWLYIVMEYLEGSSLDHILRARPAISVESKVSLMIQLCSGLAYAHSFGIIHRDIKPANIFIPRVGPPKIVDFGLAKHIEIAGQSATKDAKTSIVGTFPYMSPEQINGVAIDSRTDIWSAGITFYEILTYKLPFAGTSLVSLAKAIESDPFPSLDTSYPHVSELATILEKALAKNREQRYQTMEAFYFDLVRLLNSIEPAAAAKSDSSSDIVQTQPWKIDLTPCSQLDLGLTNRLSGKLRFQETKFTETGFLERMKYKQPDEIAKAILMSLFCLSSVILMGWLHHSGPIDSFAIRILIGIYFPLVAALAFGLFFAGRMNVTERRKCRTCPRGRMNRVSKWTRYVTSNAEIDWGYKDCIVALQGGYYDDAAKLLSVHGAEDAAAYAVIRYNIEFWECPKCSDQSALLIVEQKVDSKWRRQDLYHESYKYADRRPAGIGNT
jgi:serine/threonine protein kinase